MATCVANLNGLQLAIIRGVGGEGSDGGGCKQSFRHWCIFYLSSCEVFLVFDTIMFYFQMVGFHYKVFVCTIRVQIVL